MTTRSFQALTAVALLAPLALPGVASAGDCPLFVVGDWGVGKIDNKIMLYLGRGRYLDTPIPAPPEGPRWDRVYRAVPFVAVGACLVSAVRMYRLRQDRGAGVARRSV